MPIKHLVFLGPGSPEMKRKKKFIVVLSPLKENDTYLKQTNFDCDRLSVL